MRPIGYIQNLGTEKNNSQHVFFFKAGTRHTYLPPKQKKHGAIEHDGCQKV